MKNMHVSCVKGIVIVSCLAMNESGVEQSRVASRVKKIARKREREREREREGERQRKGERIVIGVHEYRLSRVF